VLDIFHISMLNIEKFHLIDEEIKAKYWKDIPFRQINGAYLDKLYGQSCKWNKKNVLYRKLI
jgi:hypothetical protein